MKKIIEVVKEKINNNILIKMLLTLLILMILNLIFEFLQKLK